MIFTTVNLCTTGACHHAEPTQASTQCGVCFIHVLVGALRASGQCAQGQWNQNHDWFMPKSNNQQLPLWKEQFQGTPAKPLSIGSFWLGPCLPSDLCEEHCFCSAGRSLQKGEKKWAKGPSYPLFSALLMQVSDMSSEEQSSPLSSPIFPELTWLWKEEEVFLQKCMNNSWSFQLHFG